MVDWEFLILSLRAGAFALRENIWDMANEDSSEKSKNTLQAGESDVERPADGVSMREDWRELVQRIQQETDTQRLVNLVQELIGKFDEEKMRKTIRRPGDAA